jgi:hypothetical protein
VFFFFYVCGSKSAPKPGKFSGSSSPVPPPLPNNSDKEAIPRLALAQASTPTPPLVAHALAAEPASSIATTASLTPPPAPQKDVIKSPTFFFAEPPAEALKARN